MTLHVAGVRPDAAALRAVAQEAKGGGSDRRCRGTPSPCWPRAPSPSAVRPRGLSG